MSTLCSFAIFLTSGEERWRMASSADSGARSGFRDSETVSVPPRDADAGFADATRCADGAGLAGVPVAGAAAGDGVTDAAEPGAPITATTLLTGTVSPSFARISVTTPATGDGISASTLSVEISKSGSSRSTDSPTFLIQRTMVPSAIDSPICGITTSVGIRTLEFTHRVIGAFDH